MAEDAGRAAIEHQSAPPGRIARRAGERLQNAVTGNCATALKDNPNAVILVVDADVHTVLNRPDVREATSDFLRNVLKP